jgi:Lytic transglycolase
VRSVFVRLVRRCAAAVRRGHRAGGRLAVVVACAAVALLLSSRVQAGPPDSEPDAQVHAIQAAVYAIGDQILVVVAGIGPVGAGAPRALPIGDPAAAGGTEAAPANAPDIAPASPRAAGPRWVRVTATPPAAPTALPVPPPRSTPRVYRGVATYYGAGFQGLPTASGLAFNLLDSTVTASNYWPLGTQLRVWRVEGGPWDGSLSPGEQAYYFGHSIIVTVLDRGAFLHALDLSYAAFALLGRPAEGVIAVSIMPLADIPPSAQPCCVPTGR